LPTAENIRHGSGETSAALVTFYGGMYLALAFGVLIAVNVLVVLALSVVARHAEPRDVLRTKDRERILTFVR
jgi:heme exporter protein D